MEKRKSHYDLGAIKAQVLERGMDALPGRRYGGWMAWG
jgi:hypothetical protein